MKGPRPGAPQAHTVSLEALLYWKAVEDAEVELYEGDALVATSSAKGLARLRSRRLKTYIAVGVVCGLVLIVFILVTVILIRVKTRRAQYDAERKDSYKAYEPNGDDEKDGNAMENTNKNLSSWLDSLPRSERGHHLPEDQDPGMETLPKQHTLTKTNPYRHKVLTNGSFLNLKDLPAASSGSSAAGSGDDSRPTTSTEDSSEGRGSQHSSEDHVIDAYSAAPEQGRSSRVRRSKSSNGHHQMSMQQQQSPSVLDTSTARAIIDTYSGNLFSDNYSNYVPYGSPAPIHNQQHEGNYAGYNNGFDRYSVGGGNVDYSPQRQSFRLRTESVV